MRYSDPENHQGQTAAKGESTYFVDATDYGLSFTLQPSCVCSTLFPLSKRPALLSSIAPPGWRPRHQVRGIGFLTLGRMKAERLEHRTPGGLEHVLYSARRFPVELRLHDLHLVRPGTQEGSGFL